MGCGASSSKGGAPTATAPTEVKTGSVSGPQTRKTPEASAAAGAAPPAAPSPAPAAPPAAAAPPPAAPSPSPALPPAPAPSQPSVTKAASSPAPAPAPAPASKPSTPPTSSPPAAADAPAAPAPASSSPARPASAPNARTAPASSIVAPAPRASMIPIPSDAATAPEPPLGRLPPLPGASSGPSAAPAPAAAPAPDASSGAAAAAAAAGGSKGSGGGGGGSAAEAAGTDTRPALQLPRLSAAPLVCLVPAQQQQAAGSGAELGAAEMPPEAPALIQQLASGGEGEQRAAAAALRALLCGGGSGSGGVSAPLVEALLEGGLAAALVRCIKEGPVEAQLDAAWALTNVAASPAYSHSEALCNESAPELLVALLQRLQQQREAAGGARAQGGSQGMAIQEQVLWALANISGAMHPELKTQALAVEVLDVGGLAAVLEVLQAETDAAAMAAGGEEQEEEGASGGGSPLLRCAAWCLHNLAKHKREKDMVDAIPVVTRLLLECADTQVLTCCAWVLAFLGSNEDNKSHIKQALPALPRLVAWVRDASSSLATPALLSLGTMCTGYMRALDYSGDVVEAGGVSAMLAYLRAGGEGGRKGMVKEALFALSNVAGGNTATVRAMLNDGAFPAVLSLLESSQEDEEILTECLYVLTNPWDPLVGTEVPCVQELVALGILHRFHALLLPGAPPERLGLLLKGLADGLKRGQQLMTHAANMRLVELGREGAAALPPPTNPVVDLYVQLGTVGRIEALNGHADEDVATRANGILTVLKFMA